MKIVLAAVSYFLACLVCYGANSTILNIGPEEVLGDGRLSYVTTDQLGQPHIVCDGGSMVYFYDKIGTNWRSASLNVAIYGSKQYFNPYVEIDNFSNAWYSGMLYPSTSTNIGGIGLIVRTNICMSPSVAYFSAKHTMPNNKDLGNMSLDLGRNESLIFVTGSYYSQHVYDEKSEGLTKEISRGQIYLTHGSESYRCNVSKAGMVIHGDGANRSIWHLAVPAHFGYGYSTYQNSYRDSKGQPTVVWADPNFYKEMGSDGNYMCVVGDRKIPAIAYISTDLNNDGGQGGIYANVFNGTEMVQPINNILVVDPKGTTGQRRFEPLMAPAKFGGVYIIYSTSGKLYVRYIGPNGLMANPQYVCDGTKGSIHCDQNGDLHIVYNKTKKSTVSYRKLTMSTATVVSSKFIYGNGSAMAVYDSTLGKWYVKTMYNQVLTMGTNWGGPNSVSVSGDFDGDKVGDLAVWDINTCKWYIYSVAQNKVLAWNVAHGIVGTKPVSGDYDGNGTSDLGIYDQRNGKWYIIDLTGKTLAWNVGWGFYRGIPVIGDYDGDGKFDLCVFDEYNGDWYIYSMAYAKVLAWQVNLGINNSIPISGDFDGDGKYDMAVFDIDNAKWYIKNVDGKVILWNFDWGFKGGVPGAGDFDGDGADDIVVYDYLGSIKYGNWYIYSVKKQAVLTWDHNWGFKGVTPIGCAISN